MQRAMAGLWLIKKDILKIIIKVPELGNSENISFIFLNSDGKPYTSSHSIIRYYWKPVLKKLGIEYHIPYQCRHTFAVLSLKLGDDPEDVAKQLGHTSLQLLFTRYARFIKNRAKRESKFAGSVTISARNKKASG